MCAVAAGVAEDLGCVEPGARRLLRTFATHCWRLADAKTGAAVKEFTVDYETRSVHVGTDKLGRLSTSMA